MTDPEVTVIVVAAQPVISAGVAQSWVVEHGLYDAVHAAVEPVVDAGGVFQ